MNIFCPEFATCVYNFHEITVTLFISGGKEMVIAKPCTHLHPVPFTFPQLHPAPPTFIHPHPAYFSLHLALCNILNFMRTKMSRVIGQFLQIQAEKIWSLFFLKIGTYGILEVLLPNPWLDFWNSNHKIHFLANF